MEFLEKIGVEIKEALKHGDDDVLRTLRMLKSDIIYEKAKGTEDLSDEKIVEIIYRALKKRKEAIEEYKKAGRDDLAEREFSELKIIEKYLPKQLKEEEIQEIIEKKIDEIGEITKKDFGKIMGMLMKELKGKADGAIVKRLLNEKLEKM
jgi:uncharacterized protein YqeY